MPKNDQELVDAIVDREHEKAHKIPLVVSKTEQLTEDTITSKLPEKPELIIFENKDRIVQLEQQLADVTATRRHRKTGGEVMEMIGQVCPKCGEPMAGFCRMCNPDPIKVGRIEQLTEHDSRREPSKDLLERYQRMEEQLDRYHEIDIVRNLELSTVKQQLANVTDKAVRLRKMLKFIWDCATEFDMRIAPNGELGEKYLQLLKDTEDLCRAQE